MALPTRRSYAGGAAACTLSSTINSSATSFSISGTTTGWPATAGGGFYMVIDPGLSTEEKVFVGSRSSGSLSSVTRGVDGTLAASHDAGATCYPVFTSIDADQANKLASTMTTKGDLVSTDGSDPARLGVGTNNHRLVAASGETTGLKWVADTQNTVIDAKGDLLVGSAADTIARLAVGTNDQVLIAASGETTGIKWGGAFLRTSSASSGEASTININTKPWNMPWGLVATTSGGTNSLGYKLLSTQTVNAGNTADITNSSMTFTGISGRLYRYSTSGYTASTSASGLATLSITDGSDNIKWTSYSNITNSSGGGSIAASYIFTASGSTTVKMRWQAITGNCTLFSTHDGYGVILEDIGPSS